MRSTKEKVALVTGASGGMGRATAERLAAGGYRVFAAARWVERLGPMRSGNPEPLGLDVTSEDSVDAAVGEVMARVGRLDVLVNNAGYGQYGALEEVEPEVARRQFEVNVFGPACLTQKVLPIMRRQGSGTIVNVSSVAGRVSTPFAGWYAASKHAVEALSDALRLEAKPFGVRVVLVEPGAIKTGFDRVALDELRRTTTLEAYRGAAEAFAAAVEPSYERAPGPGIVAATIHRAIEARRPRARYAVGNDSRMFIFTRRLLGDGLLDRLLENRLGGPGREGAAPALEASNAGG